MSSEANRLVKKIGKKQNQDRYDCENSLLGSIMITVGKLAGIPEKKIIENFIALKSNYDEFLKGKETIKDLVDYFIDEYKVKNGKDYIVLVYDQKGVYTPLVSLIVEDTIMAISDDGGYNGILLNAYISKDPRYEVEFIY